MLFSGLEFSVRSGQALLLHGANGSGKTSLMRALAGFVEVHEGTINVSPGQEHIGFLGHQLGLKPSETVKDALAFFQSFADADLTVLDEVLEQMALRHLSRRTCGTLSAGQKQRVALARLELSNRAIW